MKKLILTFTATITVMLAASVASFAQSTESVVAKAKQEAKKCIDAAGVPYGQVYDVSAFGICPGGDLNATIELYYDGRSCGDPVLCDPIHIKIATVTLLCDGTYLVTCN